MVEYQYDIWEQLLQKSGSLSSTLGTLNPFRYRRYVYDEEREFYATATRYYDPHKGRFINADVYSTNQILGLNLYAYCYNNPIKNSDSTGNSKWFDLGQNYRYRVDYDTMNNPDHIYIEGPDGK